MTDALSGSNEVDAPSAVRRADPVWRLALLGCAVAIGIAAGLAPLADPDLPIHMAVGEWIVQHGAVPYVEPFAWTRAGDPYYAYAWLWQTIFFVTLRDTGTLGLHLLAAVAGALVVGSGYMAGRALGLRPHAATLFAVLAGAVALESTPFLRPQLVMHSLVLLAWAVVARISGSERTTKGSLAALLALGAIAANTQITFPVLAAPLALLIVPARPNLRVLATSTLALGLGFTLTPYAITWPELVGRLSHGITAHHPLVGELRPGWAVSPILGFGLAVLPLLAAPRLTDGRRRLVFGAMWLAGLVVFTRYFKGVGPWWWCAIPLCVMALAQLPRPSTRTVERSLAALVVAASLASTISSARLFVAMQGFEESRPHGSLPSVKSFVAEPAARWLRRNMRPDAQGKLLTVFGYGSYLRWRLPSLSQSIDSRGGIFPDSATLPDVDAPRGAPPALGPWQSADVAIVPLSYPVAAVLDGDAAWQRVGACELPPWAPADAGAGLWVRREWWARAGARGIDSRDAVLRLGAEPSARPRVASAQ